MFSLRNIKFLYLTQGVAGVTFFYFGNGLLFFENGSSELKSTNTLLSSGSNDDIAIFLYGIICFLSFLFLLLKSSYKYINAVFFITTILQFFSLVLIQMGSVLVTIFYGGNFLLILILISQTMIVIIMMLQYKSNTKKNIM